ncbi:hypothetical protein ScPMuIL_003655 [Solemya velum]
MVPRTVIDMLFMAVSIACLATIGEAMNCYQCNSTLDPNCQEKFDHTKSTMSPQLCSVWNTEYCIKATGLWGGIVGTHRFCSTRDLGDQCQDVFYPDHDRMYRACVYTCTSEGCNSATSLQIGTLTIILGSLFLLLNRMAVNL